MRFRKDKKLAPAPRLEWGVGVAEFTWRHGGGWSQSLQPPREKKMPESYPRLIKSDSLGVEAGFLKPCPGDPPVSWASRFHSLVRSTVTE